MDPLTTAALAGLVGWLSIAVVVHAPRGRSAPGLRRWGAVTIALLGASVLGVPMPAWLPLAVLAGGVLVSLRPRGAAAA